MNKLRKNIFSLFILQGANYVLPLLAIPYLVRVLGPDNFGRIAFAQAFIQYFVIVTNYSFDLSATRSVALARHDAERLSRLFFSVMTIKSGVMIFGFGVMSLIVYTVPSFSNDWTLFAVVYALVAGNALFPVWFYQGLERMRHITAFTIAARFLLLICIFLFVRNSSDYVLAAGLLSSGMLLAGLISLIYIPRIADLRLRWPGLKHIQKDFTDGWHIFIAMLGGNLYNNSSVFFLGLLSSPAVVGYFAAADKLIKAVQGLVQPVSQAVFPHIATLITKSRAEALYFIGRLLRVVGLGMLGISIVTIFLAAPISNVLLGSKFSASIPLIQLMALIPFFVGVNNVFGAQFLVQFGFGRLLSLSIVIPAVVHIAALYFVVSRWSASGVAVLMTFTEMFVLLIRLAGLHGKHKAMLWDVLLTRSP